jgi:hypothetical protein
MSANTSQFPKTKFLSAAFAAVVLGSDLTTIIGRVPYGARVRSVKIYANSTITGAATHNRTFSVVNKGSDGLGATVVATLIMASGVNATALVGKTITLNATAALRDVAEGDILVLTSVHNSNGIADPGGIVEVEYMTGVGSED